MILQNKLVMINRLGHRLTGGQRIAHAENDRMTAKEKERAQERQVLRWLGRDAHSGVKAEKLRAEAAHREQLLAFAEAAKAAQAHAVKEKKAAACQ